MNDLLFGFICVGMGVIVGWLLHALFVDWHRDSRQAKPPPLIDGFVLESEHVGAFLRNNRGVLMLDDFDRAGCVVGRDSAQVKEMKAAAIQMLAFLAQDSPGKEYLFRVVRGVPCQQI